MFYSNSFVPAPFPVLFRSPFCSVPIPFRSHPVPIPSRSDPVPIPFLSPFLTVPVLSENGKKKEMGTGTEREQERKETGTERSGTEMNVT